MNDKQKTPSNNFADVDDAIDKLFEFYKFATRFHLP